MLIQQFISELLNKYWRYKYSKLDKIGTLLINLRCFPVKEALKFPIFIYSNTQIQCLNKIIIDTELKKGMIKIGLMSAKAAGKTKLRGNGTYIFHGEAQIWGGCILENWGEIDFGCRVALAENCKIMCKNKMVFEDYVHFGFNCTLMDTDFHYVLDIEKNTVSRNSAPIVIGRGTWVSSDCKFMKGSYIPKNSIVAGGCLINRNFSNEDPYQIFVGVPGKPRKQGHRRIYNVLAEKEIDKYFLEHPEKDIMVLDDIYTRNDVDIFCYSNCLNFYSDTSEK